MHDREPMHNEKSTRCLVTGGAGFIGSHVAARLLESGCEMAVVDNFSSGHRDNVPTGVAVYDQNICDPLDNVFADFRPEVVFHLAAQVSVSASVRDPSLDVRTNILGSISLIQAAVKSDVRKVIYASSGASYGPLTEVPLREHYRPLPVSPYGVSKHTVEHYLRVAKKEWGLDWAALRYSNVYGPRQDPHGEAGVVAIFIQKMLRGQSPTIFDDGELTRDYVFVEDVAEANLRTLRADLSECDDPIFNISTGKSLSVNALFSKLNDLLGSKIEAVYGPPRPGDVRHSLLDPTRAREQLDWTSACDIGEGLRRTIEFFETRVGC